MVNFLVAGVGKSGTTTLHTLLKEHPEVEMASIKEPRFFTELERCDLYARNGTWNKGFDWYHGLFSTNSPLKGEASTMYFSAEDAPGKISEYNPDMKIIFLMRHPVDRLYSHYWHERKTGAIGEDLSEMIRIQHPRVSRYFDRSCYRRKLPRYTSKFSNVLILVYEEFYQDLAGNMQTVADFLGIQPFQNINNRKENVAAMPKAEGLNKALSRLHHMYTNSGMKKVVGKGAWLRSIYRTVRRLNRTQMQYEPMSAELRQRLEEQFEGDIEFVEEYLGRTIEVWRSKKEESTHSDGA